VFTEPEPPTKTDKKKSEAAFVRYKEMVNHFMRDKRKYEDQKAKVFGVILGQCTHDVISKLESDTEFAKIEQTNNVVGLLDMLKVMSHSTAGVQNPYWAMQDQLRKITAINQGKYESVSKFYERFKGQADVIKEHLGKFYPTKLAASTDNNKKKETADESQEKLLTMIFLARACAK
jgi:hypothetical protein